MNKLEIYINGQLTDASVENSDLAVNYSISDISNLDARKSSITKTISFIGSKNNLEIFGFPDEPNVTNEINQNVTPTCKIIYDGSTILDGAFKITDVTRNYKDKVTGIKGIAIGDNGDWLTRIGGKKLSEIDLSEYNHAYTKENIALSENTVGQIGTLEDEVIVYPLINYGLMSQTSQGVLVTERKPAVQIYELIYRIFKDIGYKINSNFINGSFFKKLYLPYTNDALRRNIDFISNTYRINSDSGNGYDFWTLAGGYQSGGSPNIFGIEGIANQGYEVVIPFTDEISSGMFDNGNNFDTSFLNWSYTVPQTSLQNFTLYFTYIANGGGAIGSPSSSWRVQIRKNGVIVTQKLLTTNNFFEEVDTLETGNISVVAGDVMTAILYLDYTGYSTQVYLVKNRTFFYNKFADDLLQGNDVDLSYNLPDKTQIDLIQGLKQLFNLYFYTDTINRIITIEPRDIFFTGEINNWTDKLDLSKEISVQYIGDSINKNIVYKYNQDSSDGFVKQEQDINETILASYEQEITNKYSPDGDYENSNKIFAPTLMDIYPEIGIRSTQIPKLWSKAVDFPDFLIPDFSTKFAQRILFYNGVQSLPTGETWTFEGTVRTDYPQFYSVDEINANDNSLYFNTTRRSHGLFEKYYRNTHKILNESKIIELSIYLTPTDIEKLNFRNTIFISIDGDGTYYELQGIKNYNPSVIGSYRVELIKKVDVVKLTSLDTSVDIYPPATTTPKKAPPTGLYTIDNGSIVPVYSLDSENNIFHVQVG